MILAIKMDVHKSCSVKAHLEPVLHGVSHATGVYAFYGPASFQQF